METSIHLALQRYQRGDVGMRGAADQAGVSIGEMMAGANDRNIPPNYDETNLADDVNALR